MLKRREGMLSRLVRKLQRDERGITGLETAIILIAFVVVASVFAYTVLSAGIFSSQKGQEAVYSGLEEARASMSVKGSMFAYGPGGNVTSVSFCLVNTMKGQAIDLTPAGGNGTTNNVTIISFTDSSQHVSDVAWSTTYVGENNDDNLLENEEQVIITVNFMDSDAPVTGLGVYDSFVIEVKPVTGASLALERTLPGRIDAVMDLN
jgi:flagellin FlaB